MSYMQEWFRERMEEQIAEHIPPDIREAIRRLREAGQLPLREQAEEPGFISAIREGIRDVGVIILFLIFVLVGSIYLGQRAMFYILTLILISMILVNADKFGRLLHILKDSLVLIARIYKPFTF